MKAGWEVRPLGSICQSISTGPFGSLLGKKDYTEHGVPLINPIDIVGGLICADTVKTVSPDTAHRLSRYRMQTGDVVVARRGELGRCAQVTEEHDGWLCGTGSFFIRPMKSVLPDYLEHFIRSPFSQAKFEAASTGATMPNISNKTLSSLQIPFPPLEEQQRIVAVLDEAFEGLAHARAHTEANVQNARELFERQLAQYFSEPQPHWVTRNLGKITSKVGSGATPKGGAGAYKTEGISLIRSLNVHDRWFKPKDLAFIDDNQAAKLSNVAVEERDVLLNITGASVARCCVAPREYLPARVNQHVSIIRPDQAVVNGKAKVGQRAAQNVATLGLG